MNALLVCLALLWLHIDYDITAPWWFWLASGCGVLGDTVLGGYNRYLEIQIKRLKARR